jgi:hypothetical protein
MTQDEWNWIRLWVNIVLLAIGVGGIVFALQILHEIGRGR